MSRLIDADDVKKRGDCYPPEIRDVISNILRRTKTIKDITPVKQWRWKLSHFKGMFICSNCRQYYISTDEAYDFNYCPHCGAKMDEVNKC